MVDTVDTDMDSRYFMAASDMDLEAMDSEVMEALVEASVEDTTGSSIRK